MADFKPAYLRTLVWESGYGIIPGDDGGETYMGISRKYNQQFPGWAIIDKYKKEAGGKIKHNTRFKKDTVLEEMVYNFYLLEYWSRKARGNEIKNQQVAELVYDMVVNHGAGARVINSGLMSLGATIQMVISNGKKKPVNKITNDSLNYMNAMPAQAYAAIWKARDLYYKSDDDYERFKNGWTNRLNSFAKEITV